MGKKVFFSFHYKPDNWRASQVRNIGAIEGNKPVDDNKWEEVTEAGDKAIQQWIEDNLYGRVCTIVLIGENTAGRKWINYEIKRSWEREKGLLGIHIHNLKNVTGYQSNKGSDPFSGFTVGDQSLSSIVKAYDPPYTTSTNVYAYIKNNIAAWVDDAIEIRNRY